MAKIGVKCLTWAKYASGGDGSAIVYSTGGQMLKDYMVQGDLSMDNSKGDEYADDHLIDTDSSTTAVHLALELANMNDDMLKDFCGMEAGTNELFQTDQAAPFLGVGFMMVNRFKGTVTYEGIWIYKIQFHRDSLTASTKTENIEFGHENVTGDGVGVQLTSGGSVYFYAHKTGGANEAAIETWLKGKAGIQS